MMKITYTKEQLLTASPCADGLRFAKRRDFDFAKIYDECQRVDWLFWLMARACPLTKEQSVKLAVAFARQALPKFESAFPGDFCPRKAIESAEAWLCSGADAAADAAAARSAAAAADAAAAYAAANAAAAATYAAADAAAYAAADAAAYAAAAYAAANAAATYAAADADLFRSIIPNPFPPTAFGATALGKADNLTTAPGGAIFTHD
jgi:hypothetical protein